MAFEGNDKPDESVEEAIEQRARKIFEELVEERVGVIEEISDHQINQEAVLAYLKENYDPKLFGFTDLIKRISPEHSNYELVPTWPNNFEEFSDDEFAASSFLYPEREEDEFDKLISELDANGKYTVLDQLSLLRANVLRSYYLHGDIQYEDTKRTFAATIASMCKLFNVAIPERLRFTYKDTTDTKPRDDDRYEKELNLDSIMNDIRATQERASLEENVDPRLAQRYSGVTEEQIREEFEKEETRVVEQLRAMFENFPDPTEFLNLMLGLSQNGELPKELERKSR